MRMKDKVALVTGGTSGIGRRIVERFIEEGATVFFSGRRTALGAEVAKASGATFIEADVALEADAERSVKRTLEYNGQLHVLVNNAGGPAPADRLEDLSLQDFDEAVAVHVRGTLAHIKHASKSMRAHGQGSIVNIGSVEDQLPHCDFLSTHCPATPGTKGLLSVARIALLSDGAVVVNSRAVPSWTMSH